MRPFPLAAVALLAVSVVGWSAAPGARAAPVLDQEYLANNGWLNGFSVSGLSGYRRAETFTVGVAGTLSEVDVFDELPANFVGLNILSTAGGTPTTTVVAMGTLLYQSGDLGAFTVSLPVSVGEVLAIEPITVAPADWLANRPDTYAGGGDFFVNPSFGINSFSYSGDADDFQTFVTVPVATVPATVPEPASLALLGSSLLGLGMVRSRRKPE